MLDRLCGAKNERWKSEDEDEDEDEEDQEAVALAESAGADGFVLFAEPGSVADLPAFPHQRPERDEAGRDEDAEPGRSALDGVVHVLDAAGVEQDREGRAGEGVNGQCHQ